MHLILIEVCNDDTHEQGESNHTSQEDEDVDVDAVDLPAQTIHAVVTIHELLSICRDGTCDQTRYRSNAVNDDVPNFHPSFERQHFKQSQHGVSHIVEVKVARVGPGGGQKANTHHHLLQSTIKTSVKRRSSSTRLLEPRNLVSSPQVSVSG